MKGRVKCPSCGSHALVSKGEIPPARNFAGCELEESIPGGQLICCEKCALFFRHPRLKKSELDALYRKGESKNWQYALGDRPDWDIAEKWIAQESAGRGAILDVGCFDGQFLSRVCGKFSMYGIEIHKGAAKRAVKRGVEVIGEDYECLYAQDNKFDVVTSFDVIEHVHNPLRFLGLLAQSVRPGGRIIVASGNTDSMSWKLMGGRYWYCSIAEHISFINPRWCSHAADKLGLKVEKLEYYSHAKRGIRDRLKEALKNVVYRVSPRFAAWARRQGIGGIDAASAPELVSTPPPWLSARDHMIVLFRKSGD